MKVYKYTPALVDPQALDAVLVGRDNELDTIKGILKAAASGGSLSHPLLVGPKGIGKSHILRVIYNAISGATKTKGLNKFKSKFVPVIFSEEEYPGNITKLILLILKELEHSRVSGLPPVPSELRAPTVLGFREKEAALAYIEGFKAAAGKTLLLLIDNLNDIIERLTVEDQGALRALLMTSNSVLLIGTAPTLFDAVINHDRPFYNFFHLIWLNELSFDDAKQLLDRYADLDGKAELKAKFAEAEPKLRAIHQLAGGNPRLILSLYHIIAEFDLVSIEATFMTLLDELSPYFRERMRDLSDQQQEIIDAMAKAPGLLTPTEIAADCYLPVNVVNAQIKRLDKLGYVKKAPQRKGKRVLYDINERLFSLWRQMRVEAGRRRLGFIVRFLEIWFAPDELNEHLDMALKEISGNLTVDVQAHLDKVWYLKEALPELKGKDEADIAYGRGELEAAEAILEKRLKDNPNNGRELVRLGMVKSKLGRHAEAIEVILASINTEKPKSGEVFLTLGYAYFELEKYREAKAAYEKALKLEPQDYWAWYFVGQAHVALGDNQQAIKYLKRAVKIKPDFSLAWGRLGTLLYPEQIDKAIYVLERCLTGDRSGFGPKLEQSVKELLAVFQILVFVEQGLSLVNSVSIDSLRAKLVQIKQTGVPELVEPLAPFYTAIDYLDTGDTEIIDRLRSEERTIVEEILGQLQKKPADPEWAAKKMKKRKAAPAR